MLIQRKIDLRGLIGYTKIGIYFMAAYAALITCLYSFLDFKFLSIPWAVIPVVGVAVSFYLGFKNNSAYDRTW